MVIIPIYNVSLVAINISFCLLSHASNYFDSLPLQRLYGLGARKVIVFELGPIGCLPTITRKKDHHNNISQCVEEINQMIIDFNERLAIMLKNLTSSFKGSNFVLGHAHWLGYDAIKHPSKYGNQLNLTQLITFYIISSQSSSGVT